MKHVVAVAVSGGRDSMALLHCTARLAATEGWRVWALHVHHGLVPEADAWAALVQSACERWARRGWPLHFAMRRLQGRPAGGQSVEAWAREHRYRALTEMARDVGADTVLLAHHQNDQAETVLLQALRGAGPAGLAAMPRSAQRNGITWLRPWLDTPGDAVERYARRHRLRFVQDPSNADPRFARSRLRQAVMPALQAAFDDAVRQLATAAQRCAQTQAIADDAVQAALARCRSGVALQAVACRELRAPLQAAVVQAWLSQLGAIPTHRAVQTVLALLDAKRSGVRCDVEGGSVSIYRGQLRFTATATTAPASLHPAALPPQWPTSLAPPLRAGRHVAPGGVLVLRRVQGQGEPGVPPALLHGAHWTPRDGAMQFQRAPRTPPRSLKKAFQSAGVPAWQRADSVLVAADGRLIYVPGLGIDARVLAPQGESQMALHYEPAPGQWCSAP
jgi:tRNA(Ile)-lysidine synthase